MSHELILVIGHAVSGKSFFAETLIQSSGLKKIYLATARILDSDMQSKVDKHVLQRGAGWRTVEAPLEPSAMLADCGDNRAVLLDCASMWLTNHMMDQSNLEEAEARLFQGLLGSSAMRVVVTNDVGGGVVPDNALARQFQRAQGGLNQRLAAQADTVVQVIAGLPHVLKGAI